MKALWDWLKYRTDYPKVVVAVIAAVVAYLFVGAFLYAMASPHFVTPEMTLRNGLTDAQYEALWKVGRHPRIDQQTARAWIFQSSRYSNVTNWLGVIGKTNDFARLVVPTMEKNELLVATNRQLEATVERLRTENADLWTSYTNELARTEALSRANFELASEMTNGLYAIEKTDSYYKEREETAPDEKLRTIYHDMREYLGIIRREFETPPNGESK